MVKNPRGRGYPIDVPKPDLSTPSVRARLEDITARLSADDPITQRLPNAIAIYCVGGAVRDALLGHPSSDRDYVVVGASIEAMVQAGFQPVGADFPVFLHPITHDEYALARTERKSGKGYKGFTFNADPSVRLEDDLQRRDLTINAIAISRQGELIDPTRGMEDLRMGILRHIGPAFAEDPVRVLRLARFAARWPDFDIAPETQLLCKTIVNQGEVTALVAERVWQEVAKGLMETSPTRLLDVLEGCGAWAELHPRAQPVHADTRHALDQAAKSNAPLDVRYALLMDNRGGHTQPLELLKAPKSCIDLAQQVLARRSGLTAVVTAMTHGHTDHATPVFDWLMACDVSRRIERFALLLTVYELQGVLAPELVQRLMELAHWASSPQANHIVAMAAQDALQKNGADGSTIATITRDARLGFFKTHPAFGPHPI